VLVDESIIYRYPEQLRNVFSIERRCSCSAA